MEAFRLDGLAALVTGGGSGIGKGISLALAEAGAAVAVHYFESKSGAEEVAATIRNRGGLAVSIQADLKRPGEASRVVEGTVAALERLDIVVNNAGHLVQRCPVAEMSDDLYRTIMDVNMTTAFSVSRAALRHMLPRRSGSIINMSSAAAYSGGGSNATIYATSKAAIVGFTRGLAKEVGGQGVRVNAVAPGLIGTQFHDRFSTPESRAQTVRGIPLGREGTPEDVGRTVVFLASPAAAFVTGEVLAINGGMLFH
ncbi:MAG TPA: glucose 1-dehydrogenase [Candidatus Acidoferrum sp.]|nr:glucose 1-dehydrogenase [Candidatus Acidoferrum sp.]